MVRNVSKPTYFGSVHVLNSKVESEPCKTNSVFVINLIANMIKISQNTILNTVNSASGFIDVSHIPVCIQHFCPINKGKIYTLNNNTISVPNI